jgi:hypothetical protein
MLYRRLASLRSALEFLTYLHRHHRRELGDKPRRDNVKRYQYSKDTFHNSFNKFSLSSTEDENLLVASSLSDKEADLRVDSDAVCEEEIIASSDLSFTLHD